MAEGEAALGPVFHRASSKNRCHFQAPTPFFPWVGASSPAHLALLPNWGLAQASAPQKWVFTSAALA